MAVTATYHDLAILVTTTNLSTIAHREPPLTYCQIPLLTSYLKGIVLIAAGPCQRGFTCFRKPTKVLCFGLIWYFVMQGISALCSSARLGLGD